MKKVLLSVFACDPGQGSEPGIGWNWAKGLADEGLEVHCLTLDSNRAGIESYPKPDNLHFYYVGLIFSYQSLRRTKVTLYLHYLLWQWVSYRKGKKLHKKINFDLVHHATWGNLQLGSFLYKIKAPFIFGPAGGGQKTPEAFKGYFLKHWKSEIKREKVGRWLVKNNPAFKNTMKNARLILTANQESLELAKSAGAKKCILSTDHGSSSEIFGHRKFVPKPPVPGTLKLLWVGRFLPRKALLLNLDVMIRLKEYKNITLTVVGDGEMREEITKKIKSNGLEDTVKLVGSVPYSQVKDYYSSHDAFFFTSLRDSGPAQLTEAMAFGLPIITINLHGQGFIVTDKTGIRCRCETPEIAIEELEKAIIYLYNNPDKLTQMSLEAYKYASEQTWSAKIGSIVKQHYSFLDEKN